MPVINKSGVPDEWSTLTFCQSVFASHSHLTDQNSSAAETGQQQNSSSSRSLIQHQWAVLRMIYSITLGNIDCSSCRAPDYLTTSSVLKRLSLSADLFVWSLSGLLVRRVISIPFCPQQRKGISFSWRKKYGNTDA